jgi:hypothetical protein
VLNASGAVRGGGGRVGWCWGLDERGIVGLAGWEDDLEREIEGPFGGGWGFREAKEVVVKARR